MSRAAVSSPKGAPARAPDRPPGLLRLLPLRGGGHSVLRSLQVQKGQRKRSTGFRRPRLPGPTPARFPRHARRRSQRADFPRRPEEAARSCHVGAGRSAPLCLRACGPPPVWRGAVRLVLCSPADSARCRTASAGPSFRPGETRDSRGPFRALPLRPVRPCALRRAGFFRPLRRRVSTVRSRLGRRPVSRAAARLCSSIRPAGRLPAARFPGAVGQLHRGQGLQLWAVPSSWAGCPWPGAVRPRGAVRISQATFGPSVRARAPRSGRKALCPREVPGSRGVRAAPLGRCPPPGGAFLPGSGVFRPSLSPAAACRRPLRSGGPSSRNVSSVPGGGTSSSLPDVSPPPKLATAASGAGAVSPSARTRMSWADVRPGALPKAGAPAPEIRSAPPSRGTGAPSRRMLRCSAGLWNPSVCPAGQVGRGSGTGCLSPHGLPLRAGLRPGPVCRPSAPPSGALLRAVDPFCLDARSPRHLPGLCPMGQIHPGALGVFLGAAVRLPGRFFPIGQLRPGTGRSVPASAPVRSGRLSRRIFSAASSPGPPTRGSRAVVEMGAVTPAAFSGDSPAAPVPPVWGWAAGAPVSFADAAASAGRRLCPDLGGLRPCAGFCAAAENSPLCRSGCAGGSCFPRPEGLRPCLRPDGPGAAALCRAPASPVSSVFSAQRSSGSTGRPCSWTGAVCPDAFSSRGRRTPPLVLSCCRTSGVEGTACFPEPACTSGSGWGAPWHGPGCGGSPAPGSAPRAGAPAPGAAPPPDGPSAPEPEPEPSKAPLHPPRPPPGGSAPPGA